MEERTGRSAPGEPPAPPEVIVSGGPPHLADPRALTILTTEHWSLLNHRSHRPAELAAGASAHASGAASSAT